MIIQSKAVVIHALRYGEADLIALLYTKTSGLRSYLLKNILKSKKGKIRSSLFQPLTLLEIQAIHKDKGSLERIKEAKVAIPYTTLHTDYTKRALAFFIAEILKNSIREEETNTSLFEYLETALVWLDTNDTIANYHIAFLIKLTQYLGFYPDISHIQYSYFNIEEGIFQPHKTNSYCTQENHIVFFKSFLGTTFEGSMHIKLSKTIRNKILTMLLLYFELHLHGFKKPKSFSVLNEIFN